MNEKYYSIYSIKLGISGQVLYIGRTVNFKNRICEHKSRAFGERAPSEWQPVHRVLREFCFGPKEIEFSEIHLGLSESDSKFLEISLIKELQPPLNVSYGPYPDARIGTELGYVSPLKGKQQPKLQGVRHSAALLTEAEVIEIFTRAHAGEKQKQIADDYSIERSQVSHIKRGAAWKHMTQNLNIRPDTVHHKLSK